ncbi:hypothetical protein [Flavimaricola marinus]|uniref:Chromosome partition protein Smc n=1 Tax=Flavimaricola marinus TaxID=1819565 RepID=A0A238LE70_9RHOB|nr:hypothetical protein [Flavimaricola marinus]SMY07230.1 Chromosome partition protein Smc [Flavimaricola marinus]
MARKTKTTANNSGPKGPVVDEETVEDAIEVTDESAPSKSPDEAPADADVTDQAAPELADDPAKDEAAVEEEVVAPSDEGETAAEEPTEPSDVEEVAEVLSAPDEDVTDPSPEAPSSDEPSSTREPVPTPPAPIPTPEVTVQKVGFVPLVLGGIVAAALGFGAAWFYFGQQGSILADRIADQSNKIAELESQIAAIPTDVTDLGPLETGLGEANASVSALTTRLDEVGGGLASLDERLTAVERAPTEDGTLAETAIASWERELDTIRAEIAAQQDRLQEIATNAQADLEASRAAAQEVEQNAAEAAEQAVVRAALARVQVALDSGTPFDAALSDLTEAGTEAPAALSDVAATGVPTISDLKDTFPAAARAALAAARSSGEADRDINPVTAFLRNQFDVRSVAPRDGDDPDAILSRAGAALTENRLTDAMAEIESLPEVSRVEMADWIGQAEARMAAMAAVESLDQSMNN